MRDVLDAAIDAVLALDPDRVQCVGAYRVEGLDVLLFSASRAKGLPC